MLRWMIRLMALTLVSLGLFTVQAASPELHVPILMYHYIGDLPPHADATRRGLTVSTAKFRDQMQYLHDHQYSVISLYQLYDALKNDAVLPAKPIVLTFDDGYEEDYTNVLPILQQFGYTATFFIITNPVDAGDPAYLSWKQIQDMAAAGMSMEDHTRTHVDLRRRTAAFLTNEIQGSMDDLKARDGQASHMFAYPSGRYDAETLKVLDGLPVMLAVTTTHGFVSQTSKLLELPRLRVLPEMSIKGFAAMLGER